MTQDQAGDQSDMNQTTAYIWLLSAPLPAEI